jgi:PAS domain S-box-containing protein
MEQREINREVLLELAIHQPMDGTVEELTEKMLAHYMRKLECSVGGIIRHKELEVCIPQKSQKTKLWNAFQQLVKKAFTSKNQHIIEKNVEGKEMVVFPMANFGMMMLVPIKGFKKTFQLELQDLLYKAGKFLLSSLKEEQLTLFQTFIDHTSDALHVVDELGQMQYVNKLAAERLGIDPAESRKYKVTDFSSLFSSEEEWQDHLDEIREKKFMTLDSTNLHHPTGKMFPVEVTVRYVRVSGKGFIIANSRDISKRKMAERELQDKTQQLESIFHEMSDVVWTMNIPDFKVNFITPSAQKLTGYDIDQLISSPSWWDQLIPDEDKNLPFTILDKIKKEGGYNLKHRIKTKDGSIKYVRNRGKLIYNQKNKPIRLDCVVMDRTSQYQVQKRLKEEMDLQEILINISTRFIKLDLEKVAEAIQQSLKELGVFVKADRGYISDLDGESGKFSKIYEWKKENIASKQLSINSLSFEAQQPFLNHMKEKGSLFISDVEEMSEKHSPIKELLKKQNIKSIIVIPMISHGQLKGVIGFDFFQHCDQFSEKEETLLYLFSQMLINIQDRFKWERQLKWQEEKFRNIIFNMNLGLVEVNDEGKVVFANQSFCNMSGFTLPELSGKRVPELLSYNLAIENSDLLSSGNHYHQPGNQEVQGWDKNGKERWWLISEAPNYNDEGKKIGAIHIHLDISQQKSLERKLAKAKNFAEQAAHAKELFLANMSHEIRTPLNGIIGMVRLLSKEELSPSQKYYVDSSSSAAKHLLAILNNILDMAKIDLGELTLEESPFSVPQMVEELSNMLLPQAKSNGIELKTHLDPELSPYLLGDEARIRQILINLVSNSIKFTEEGSINIKVWPTETTKTHQKVMFEVKDTGIGISEKFVDNIFDKFSQEHNKRSKKFTGTGLGMTISRDLALLMNSDIHIKSKKGDGTQFSFALELPLADGANLSNSKPSHNCEKDDFEAKVVLIVEDNEMSRFIARQSISSIGCKIIEACNGEEALQKAKSEAIDLVLMDIRMPVMDGLEATKIMREEMKFDQPILALTANVFQEYINSYLEAGMDDYLTKPFEESELLQRIRYYLRNKRKRKINE